MSEHTEQAQVVQLDDVRELLAEDRLNDLELWSAHDLARYFRLSSTKRVYNLLACKPDFPQAVKWPGLSKRWRSAEVRAWANQQTKGRPRLPREARR
ncbi:MAG: helix-turn-helix transcriptional regulator [Pseudomonadota bacterium]